MQSAIVRAEYVLWRDVLFPPMVLLVSAILMYWLYCLYYFRFRNFVWLIVWSWCEFDESAELDYWIPELVFQRQLLLLSLDSVRMDCKERNSEKLIQCRTRKYFGQRFSTNLNSSLFLVFFGTRSGNSSSESSSVIMLLIEFLLFPLNLPATFDSFSA